MTRCEATDLALIQGTFSQPTNLTSMIQFVFEYMKPFEVIVSTTVIPECRLFIEPFVVLLCELFKRFGSHGF